MVIVETQYTYFWDKPHISLLAVGTNSLI